MHNRNKKEKFFSCTCCLLSFSLIRISSIRRLRSSSFCSRYFCAAIACALSSSSLRCRSKFCWSFISRSLSSRSRAKFTKLKMCQVFFIFALRLFKTLNLCYLKNGFEKKETHTNSMRWVTERGRGSLTFINTQ